MALPFISIAVYKFDKAVHPAFRGIRESFGRLNTKVQENISGIHTVKALSKEQVEIERFNQSNQDYRSKQLYTASIWSKYFPLMELIGNISVVAITWLRRLSSHQWQLKTRGTCRILQPYLVYFMADYASRFHH